MSFGFIFDEGMRSKRWSYNGMTKSGQINMGFVPRFQLRNGELLKGVFYINDIQVIEERKGILTKFMDHVMKSLKVQHIVFIDVGSDSMHSFLNKRGSFREYNNQNYEISGLQMRLSDYVWSQ